MPNLTQHISELTDREAIQAASYVTEWMQQKLKQDQKLPTELQGVVTDDQAADLLGEAFADLSDPLQQASLTANESQRGQIARNLLLVLAEDEQYASIVQEAMDQLIFKFEPVTAMAVAAGIVFLLSLEFEVEVEEVNGKKKLRWRIARKATPTEIVKKVLSFGVTG